MSKIKKNDTLLKIHNHKKSSKNYFVNKNASVVGGLYTYKSKRRKRLGKDCIYFDFEKLTCKTTKSFCKNAEECVHFVSNHCQSKSHNKPKINPKTQKYYANIGITAIVVTNNKECIFSKHTMTDVLGILRIVTPSGTVNNYKIPMIYCQSCITYYVLKKDYKLAKTKGVILCQIITKTNYENRMKYKTQIEGKESRIHELGYNVKQGSNYTNKQRQAILANIIENTDINKSEIQRLIRRCINQHKSQNNYSNAIRAWETDYQFLSTYKHGDIPQVIIDKIKIGR